jgi:hypothetical protein
VFKVLVNLGKIYKNTFSSQILVNQYQLIDSQFRDYFSLCIMLLCSFMILININIEGTSMQCHL